MLEIRSDIIQGVRQAKQASDLFPYLQGAIELEHATIPAYLQALYSIKPGQNPIVAGLIRSIVVEEMLHMTIAANVLNAIGGQPVIDKPGFIPKYPGPLPMNIHAGLQVGLAPLSKTLIQTIFMPIETPEDPQTFPTLLQAVPAAGYATIGLFYAAIEAKIRGLGQAIFTGDPARQVVDNTWFPADQLFPIHDVASAVAGLEVIVDQGEGSKKDPLDPAGQPAHYYRFAEIFYGARLIPNANVPEKYSYTGAPIPFDPAGIWDLAPNPTVAGYPAGSTARVYAERFNTLYCNLLRSLHVTFNGAPQHLRAAIAGMYELRLSAEALIQIRDPASGKQAAPTFEYALQTA